MQNRRDDHDDDVSTSHRFHITTNTNTWWWIPDIGIIFAANNVCVCAARIWLFLVNNFQTMTLFIVYVWSSLNWCYQHRFTLACNNTAHFSLISNQKPDRRYTLKMPTFRLNSSTIKAFFSNLLKFMRDYFMGTKFQSSMASVTKQQQQIDSLLRWNTTERFLRVERKPPPKILVAFNSKIFHSIKKLCNEFD